MYIQSENVALLSQGKGGFFLAISFVGKFIVKYLLGKNFMAIEWKTTPRRDCFKASK